MNRLKITIIKMKSKKKIAKKGGDDPEKENEKP